MVISLTTRVVSLESFIEQISYPEPASDAKQRGNVIGKQRRRTVS
jgi:hypothetical protein